jgi:hypothetical protein
VVRPKRKRKRCNANNGIARQPQIVSSGSVYQLNSKPTIIAERDQNWSFSAISTNLYSLFITYYKTATGNQQIIGSGNTNYMWLDYQSKQYIAEAAFITISSNFNINTQYTYNAIASSTSGAEIWRNNISLGTRSAYSGNDITEFPYKTLRTANLHLQEMIIYTSDQSSNRTGIETNINDFYSIYYVPSDSDAQAFVSRVETAGGSLSYTEAQAVDTLVSDLKDAGIWSKMKAIYPMVGASAAACAQNLKSSSFTGTFNGGVTFSSNGVKFNGTSGYLDTQFVPSVEFGAGNGSISVYSRTSGSRSADFGRYTGSQNAIVAYVSLNGRVYSYFGDTGYNFEADTNNGLGLFNYQRTSNSNKNVFVNSTKLLNANTTFTGWPNLFMPIGAYFLNTTFQETSGRI